jgi:hypothetical protein
VNCNISSYTVDVAFQNGTYTILSSTLGSVNLTNAVTGILARSIDIPSRLATVAQTFTGAISVLDFMPILERALAEVTLAWSSGLFQTTDTTELRKLVERPGTRYPLPYLIALVMFYGLYAAMALYIAALAVLVSS